MSAGVRVYRIRGRADLYALQWDHGAARWRRRSTGMTTQAAALRVAREWRREGELIASGELPATAALRRATLEAHIEAFLAAKRTDPKQLSASHLADTAACLRRVMAEGGWTMLSEVTLDGLQAVLERMSEPGYVPPGDARRGKRPIDGQRMSNARLNHYRAAWKALTRWAHRTGRLDADPLGGMPRWRTEGYERTRRMALTVEEFGRLVASTRDGMAERSGRSAEDRAMAYLLAASTGLRLAECASLSVDAFALDVEAPTVRLAARRAKSRRGARQPVLPDAVKALRRWLAGRPAEERPLGWLTSVDAAAMIREDARSAGLATERTDVDGVRVTLDFHALRHTYGTWLTTVLRLHPREAQRLMRHSTMDLTMRLYTHLDETDLAGKIASGVQMERCAGAARSTHTTGDQTGPHGAHGRAQEGMEMGRDWEAGPSQASAPQACDPPSKPPPAGAEGGCSSEVAVGFEPTNNGFAIPKPSDSKSVDERHLERDDSGRAAPALRGGDSASDDPRPAGSRRRSARERIAEGEDPSADRAIASILSGLRLLGVQA